LKKQGRNIDITKMAYYLGEGIKDQKARFCGLKNGPKSLKNDLHILDLCYVSTRWKQTAIR
jgi:hypothetical protein